MSHPSAGILHVVQRQSWVWGADWQMEQPGEEPVGTPVRAFADETAARAFAREQSQAARLLTNPFRFCYEDPDEWCSGGSAGLLALTAGWHLPPPAETPRRRRGGPVRDWPAWWDAHYPDLTPNQRDAIWDRFDKLELFVVTTAEWED